MYGTDEKLGIKGLIGSKVTDRGFRHGHLLLYSIIHLQRSLQKEAIQICLNQVIIQTSMSVDDHQKSLPASDWIFLLSASDHQLPCAMG